VSVDPARRVGCFEWKRTGQDLVEDDSQGIQVGALVHLAVQATGLLRREIAERPVERAGVGFPEAPSGVSKSQQPDRCIVEHEDVTRIQMLVDDASAMDLRKSMRDRDPEDDRAIWGTVVGHDRAERLPTHVLEHQPVAAVDFFVAERVHNRSSGKKEQDRLFVMEVRVGSRSLP